jgi:hypothetical protein
MHEEWETEIFQNKPWIMVNEVARDPGQLRERRGDRNRLQLNPRQRMMKHRWWESADQTLFCGLSAPRDVRCESVFMADTCL